MLKGFRMLPPNSQRQCHTLSVGPPNGLPLQPFSMAPILLHSTLTSLHLKQADVGSTVSCSNNLQEKLPKLEGSRLVSKLMGGWQICEPSPW